MTTKAGVVGGALLLLAVAVAAFVLAFERHSAASENAATAADSPDVPGRGVAIGSPEPLPLITTKLTDEERDVAENLPLGMPDVVTNLDGKRYQVVGEELAFEKIAPCDDPDARACATIAIFNYTDGYCLRVLVDLENRKPLGVDLHCWCSISSAEVEQARRIAEADAQDQEVLRQGQGKFMSGRTIIPRSSIRGHRYVGVGYTLANGTASAEFVVDLTTQIVCHEC